MENALLDIQNVSKFYTNKVALQNVSIQVPKGSIYGLLGPNGAGKTSLIRIINQITQADEGQVFIHGEKLGPSHIKDIGYLPEERGLYKKIKVVRQLEYFARLRGLSAAEASERAAYWLKRMGLYDVRNKKIEELSKGMQQKIQFIVSVINSPGLLILDEPFSGFDPVNAELLTEVILELKQKGTTIIFSTHRMESVEKLCDYMALIHLSKKILDGKVSEIRRQFISDKFEVITEKPITLDHGSVCIDSRQNEIGQYWYMLKLNGMSPNDFLNEIMKQTEIVGFNRYMPSINDIFIQLVTQ
jgi:ABC-2 type transport system ATP-binding protein